MVNRIKEVERLLSDKTADKKTLSDVSKFTPPVALTVMSICPSFSAWKSPFLPAAGLSTKPALLAACE